MCKKSGSSVVTPDTTAQPAVYHNMINLLMVMSVGVIKYHLTSQYNQLCIILPIGMSVPQAPLKSTRPTKEVAANQLKMRRQYNQ